MNAARLFDTNIIIDALNRYEPARALLAEAEATGGGIALSRISWIEVLAGARGANLASTEAFLRGCHVIEISAAIAARTAELRRETKLKLADAMIWATALETDRVLVTRDRGFPEGGAVRPYVKE